MQAYPEGLDCVWLAVDDRGVLAAFITAGRGPIPDPVLAHATDVTEMEGLLHELLPRRCEASLRADVAHPEGYLAPCRLGLHVYDWTDVHLVRPRGSYALVAVPAIPLHIEHLPLALREVAYPLEEHQRIGAERIRVAGA